MLYVNVFTCIFINKLKKSYYIKMFMCSQNLLLASPASILCCLPKEPRYHWKMLQFTLSRQHIPTGLPTHHSQPPPDSNAQESPRWAEAAPAHLCVDQGLFSFGPQMKS